MSLESNVDNLEIRNADKITFVGTSNTVVNTTTGRLGIGTDTPEDTLHVNGGIRFAGHILPTQNATFDIGSATNKVRDLFLHNNSLWIGDQSKIAFSDGKLKFKRRKLDKVPKVVKDLAIANGLTDEAEVATYAVAFANAIDPTITEVADLKLEHWRDYTQTFDSTKAISDIFVDNYEDYEAVAAADAFMEVGSNIFTTHSVSIGGTAAPRADLDVVGTGSIIVPSGTTDQRPATGINGMLRYNSTTGYMEAYTVSGWGSIATPPTIQTFSPASVAVADVTTQVFTVTGAFFDAQTTIQLQGADNTLYDVTDFTFTNSGSIGFKMGTLASGQAANRPFKVVATNGADLTATSTAMIGFTGLSWTSPAAGATLATFSTLSSANNTELAATDDVGGTNRTFSVVSANLPSPLALNTSTGAITGIITAVGTTSVTFRITDNVTGTTLDRTFSIVGMDGLFAFTSHTFTRAAGDVRFGPTFDQMKTAYNSTVWYNTTAWFNQVSGKQGFQLWTVPKTGTYRITAKGAQGGRTDGLGTYNNSPGNGAHISADIALMGGTKIVIIVGQAGEYPIGNSKSISSAGGGGATWILKENFTTANDQVYMVAGGGAGAERSNTNHTVGSADGSSQGILGAGGAGNGWNYGDGGGAGWTGNGTGTNNSEGLSPTNGAAGGNYGYTSTYASVGGFGGGGGGGLHVPGGGGGASGGRTAIGAMPYNSTGSDNSQGGTSYIITTATNRTFSGNHSSYEGSVYIQAPGQF